MTCAKLTFSAVVSLFPPKTASSSAASNYAGVRLVAARERVPTAMRAARGQNRRGGWR